MRCCYSLLCCVVIAGLSCSKGTSPEPEPTPIPGPFTVKSITLNGKNEGYTYRGVPVNSVIRITFSTAVDRATVAAGISYKTKSGAVVAYTDAYEKNDSILVITSSAPLQYITGYTVDVTTALKSKDGVALKTAANLKLATVIDSTDKFPRISDEALLDLVQQQTFKYFWDFGHPVSGMARERNSSGDICTTGGTGFGVMSMLAAVNRNFITRTEALQRIQKIVNFYQEKCTPYHGAFAHWINGSTGATIPFSAKDDGADLVETSFLMQGLLCARQYFNTTDAAEAALRADINSLWDAVEWNCFRKSNENVLYWHWSPNFNWDMNMKIAGWNEALIVYVLAAASNTSAIQKAVYDNGWALNGAMKNNNAYFGITLPLGPPAGGPMFLAHYSFLGINPHQLTDAYADYWTQDTAHAMINYNHCVSNPSKFYGYSNLCWGLTASDEENGYNAHAPNNDNGTISPTAAIASLPYAPEEAMETLKFFYYTMGDKLWGEYGFIDAFNLHNTWFADSYLAIDQGPEIVMIENYRSGLLWNLLMSCPEIKTSMTALGFSSPHL